MFREIPVALLELINTAHKADPVRTEANLIDLRDRIYFYGYGLDTQALITSLRIDRDIERREGES